MNRFCDLAARHAGPCATTDALFSAPPGNGDPTTVSDFPSPQCRRHAAGFRARRGVSLLEVTFSIGVVVIGLVGIAALLPLGGALARKGAIADSAAQLGANAVREFSARGMAIPSNWRWYNTAGASYQAVTMGDGITPRPGTSFCLDPFYISAATSPAELALRAQFPLNITYDNSLIAMPRLTLRSTFAAGGVLDATAAQRLFVGADDLIFDLPTDRTLGPVQNFSFLDAAPVNPLKRNSQGHTSWMATIVPKLDRLASLSGTVTPTDEYTLSIIVFDRRPVDRELVGANEDDVSERVVSVATFYSGIPAFSGGDVTLAARTGRGATDLELRSGDWVLFSGIKTTLAGPVQVHQWYRVVNPGEDPAYNGTLWTRDVTVVGPDWDMAIFPRPQVTIVRGVVQVLERTIRLETSSIWTN